jgi:hypothetical protein
MFFARWDIFVSSIFLYIKEKSKRITREGEGGRQEENEEGQKGGRC